MIRIQRILVPTDFSDPADAALRYAEALAEEFGSRVHVLHVVPEPYVYPWGTELSAVPLADILTQSEEAAKEKLAKLVPTSGPLKGRVTTETAIGTPVQRILDYIKEREIDFVVLGTHGRGAVGHLLLGSVAERVVRHARVPVLTVHSQPAQ